jgi:hypothetical protein
VGRNNCRLPLRIFPLQLFSSYVTRPGLALLRMQTERADVEEERCNLSCALLFQLHVWCSFTAPLSMLTCLAQRRVKSPAPAGSLSGCGVKRAPHLTWGVDGSRSRLTACEWLRPLKERQESLRDRKGAATRPAEAAAAASASIETVQEAKLCGESVKRSNGASSLLTMHALVLLHGAASKSMPCHGARRGPEDTKNVDDSRTALRAEEVLKHLELTNDGLFPHTSTSTRPG